MPGILEAARAVERYGTAAVYGRIMSVGEIRSLEIADRVQASFTARQAAPDIVEWAKAHPAEHSFLNEVMRWQM